MNTTIITPGNEAEWGRAKGLVEQYIASLNLDLSFQNVTKELANICMEYSLPTGGFFLAVENGKDIGCVALRKYKDDICEMKRLYITPDARGKGVGKLLIGRIIEEARKLQYNTMLLDTLPDMIAAQSIYKQFGFTEIPPYRFNPVEGTSYLQLVL